MPCPFFCYLYKTNLIIMKRFLLTLSVLALCFSAFAAPDTLRVLAVGNSFSQDAVEQNLHEIAAADGTEMIIGNMYIGGCSVERHYQNTLTGSTDYLYRKVGTDGVRRETPGVTLEQAFADEKWDIVTLQQCSGESGLIESYEPYVHELLKFFHAHAPQAAVYWHQTWAYAKGAVHGEFPHYDRDQMKMYEAIMKCSRAMCDKYGLTVIPSGTAIQNLRATHDRDNCTRDGFHLNHTVGRYTAALTWYEALTGRSVIGNSYRPEGLTAERAELAQHSAHAAVGNPWSVSDFGFRKMVTNSDESAVAPYTLPDALKLENGRKVRNAKQWTAQRRPELLRLFAEQMYGTAPGALDKVKWEEKACDNTALGGIATRREIRLFIDPSGRNREYITLLIYTPNGVDNAPALMGLNFRGNETVSLDEGVMLPDKNHRGRYGVHPWCQRGSDPTNVPVEEILKRGYALVTACADDIDPDFDDSFVNAVHGSFKEQNYTWGTIAAWSWGLSRMMDYLQESGLVDPARVGIYGFSRMGKAALWAGAQDERFAMVASIQSGCGGAALSRHGVGETVHAINAHFPHWFCMNFNNYNDNESALPFDQHELLALVAPRPLLVLSASQATWLNPVGEQKAAEAAAKVYGLWGRKALSKLGTHVSDEKHMVSPEDWSAILDFADKNL